MLYACDLSWWNHNVDAVDRFEGVKVTQDPGVSSLPRFRDRVHRVKCDHKLDKLVLGTFGEVGWGGNGGFQALNIVVQSGANPIVLVGFDMRLDRGLHWHANHPRGMNNPSPRNVERWRRVMDEQAPVLAALGVTVLNASPISALRNYRKISLDEVFTQEALP
jgi:hypothetical protein